MFIFREEYYLSRAEPTRRPEESEDKFNDRYDRWKERCEATFGMAEIIIAKQRHGPIGTVKLHFEAETTKFDNLHRPRALADRRLLSYAGAAVRKEGHDLRPG